MQSEPLKIRTDGGNLDQIRAIFEEKWRRLESRRILSIYFRRQGVPEAEIPDRIGETAFQACRSMRSLKNWDKFDPWIMAIAKNMLARYWRTYFASEKKREALEGQFLLNELPERDEKTTDRLIIEECLDKLDEIDRSIVVYRALEDYKFREISEFTGKSTSSVERHYRSAIENLRKCVEGKERG